MHYPDGKVVAAYGPDYEKGTSGQWENIYCGQHAVKVTQDGLLFLFNNNSCNADGFPAVEVLREPENAGGMLQKVWEYSCSVEGKPSRKMAGYDFTSGGNVSELPNGDFFVSMSSSYGKMFMVSRDKKVLWSALPERWEKTTGKWQSTSEYRASLISSRAELECLIWAAQQPANSKPQLLMTH